MSQYRRPSAATPVNWDELFRKATDRTVRRKLESALGWDADTWLKYFWKYSAAKDRNAIRGLRIAVMQSTITACKNMRYIYGPENKTVPLCGDVQEYIEQAMATKFYDFTQKTDFTLSIEIPTIDTKIEVIDGDCLDQALRLKSLGLNPVVLNMASHRRPGGGYMTGAGAQEENLFRRTNYYLSLEDPNSYDKHRNWKYPLPEFSLVYSPKVFVFRSSEQTGYAFLEKPVEMAFIACPAYSHPATTERNGKLWLTDEYADGTCRKLRGLFWTALENGHDSIVLSAFGCGAFANPPHHIAQLFHLVLNEPNFKGKFKHVVFAIFDDHNARKKHNPEGNVKPFLDVFGK